MPVYTYSALNQRGKASKGIINADSPRAPAIPTGRGGCGGVPEWLKGADCKSAGSRLRWFESNPLHISPARSSRDHSPGRAAGTWLVRRFAARV